ncbi:NHLP leader peptide family RiPP precursor [Tenacibaculum ovolyticum]|uniref:NHLP leader peptide family RiPP precursor n=1 Tax=Tenacibaculum ovolyticum TaxID=104270 RepID=UPI0022F3E328|nr:NHLP leader peptide family RiPP precursor [Tenacibaculum ovolyticum]WBX76789.1 NHLP leader peptide family RiPP precursor [Tenacibaculum ovolyticum]
MEMTQEQKLYQDVVQKAWEDVAFKEELVANPVAAIEKLTGAKLNLPEGKTIVVRDQTNESTVYINIPAEQKLEDVELNDDQLEAVAGGVHVVQPFVDVFGRGIPLGAGGPGPIDESLLGQNSTI